MEGFARIPHSKLIGESWRKDMDFLNCRLLAGIGIVAQRVAGRYSEGQRIELAVDQYRRIGISDVCCSIGVSGKHTVLAGKHIVETGIELILRICLKSIQPQVIYLSGQIRQ